MFTITENVLHDHRQKYTVLCNYINYIITIIATTGTYVLADISNVFR